MSSFKLAFHAVTGRRIVEVMNGTDLIACIYPGDDTHDIKILSKHPMEAIRDDASEPRAILITIEAE